MEEESEIDYRLVCRTCLASDAEFYKLDAPIIADDEEQRISFMECLRYCTRLEDVSQYPIYICTECSSALQVAYNFIRNAVEAHEILRQKLCPFQRNNGLHGAIKSGATDNSIVSKDKTMRYRCKICGEKVDTKKSLKEHVKLHLDIISYCCQFCNFECKKRRELGEHYTNKHGVQATRDQLKPNTTPETSASAKGESKEDLVHDDIYLQMEKIHNSTIPIIPAQPKSRVKYNEWEQQFRLQQEQKDLEHREHIEKQRKQKALQQKMLLRQQEEEDKELEQQQQLEQQQLELAIAQQQSQELEQHQQQLLQQQSIESSNILSADGSLINGIPTEMQDFGGDFTIGNEMSIGNEFIVMADGTVQEVMGNGVVIEYINAAEDGITLDNEMVLNNMVQLEHNDAANAMVNMDVDDIIIEESVGPELPETDAQANIEDAIQSTMITVPTVKRVKCRICANNFSTQDQLKIHMLTHNEIPHFFCDQCTFYTFFKIDLIQHYKTKHKTQPTYKQLQPKNKGKSEEASNNIYTCDLCLYETSVKTNLRRHYLSKHQVEATDVQLRPSFEGTDIDSKPVPDKKFRLSKADFPNGLHCKICNKLFYWRSKLKEHNRLHKIEESLQLKQNSAEVNQQGSQNEIRAPSEVDVESTLPDMSYIVPSDELPQVSMVETVNAIENDIEFDFNGDALFADFDYDEHENDNDNEDFQDLLLTSEDDFEDLLEEQSNDSASGSTQQQCPFCMQCNKKFFSQYQFENHMFVHRGLAPYRCEMCTNLYNTKRALIRHYKAVHKKVPTRDMIQAKGDKVTVDRMPVEHLNLEEQKALTLMCAKCPYETMDRNNLQIHLSTSHGVTDENYILQKLPFECPRCIRSYQTKVRLIRHLERSHSVATIIQQQRPTTPVRNMSSSAGSRSGKVDIKQTTTSQTSIINTTDTITNEPTTDTATITTNNNNTTIITAGVAATTSETEIDIDNSLLLPPLNAGYPLIYECKICHSICDSQEALNIHKSKLQHQSPPPSDDGGGDGLLNNNNNFNCDICKRPYKSKILLRLHLKRHFARKYRCAECPKTYTCRSELENHRLSHTGEMPHKCTMCSKQFRYSHHLKRHTDVQHFGKRVTCEVEGCGRKFTTLAQLNIHAWNHNGNIPYKCNYCGCFLKKRDSLRQHCKKMHNVTLTEEQIAEIYRQTVGYTNRHDFTVPVSDGSMLRRSDVEATILLN